MFHFKRHGKRAVSLLLGATLLLGSVPFTPPASAGTEWVQESIDKLTNWGVITRSDSSAQRLNSRITRAEFTAMINRAYGYSDTGETPFTDVPAYAWYADDISIGYNAGYFSGTTETTASPNNQLTREQAITLLGRNMRLPETSGEVTQFSDGRSFSNWSKGYIKSAVDSGIVNGFDDGTFRPGRNISRAEMIKLLADSLGTLINVGGVHTLGGISGNLTINTPNTTLRNTTIAGDLYLTGGVGLGGVTLENVNVLGRIIVAGGGESENSDSSIVLRNVAAQSMLVDSLSGQYVSLSVQNDSLIPTTTVKTNAYIEDLSADGMGLQNIILDGEPTLDEDGNPEDMEFTLAGNIKNATNKTPESQLTVGRDVTQNLTISEEATDSTLIIEADARVDNLNLDAGIRVSGDGDIGTLNVSAPGVRTSMLPDEIIIRPGLTANIAGTTMDPKLAEESSSEPRLLAGYPKADDVAPTSVNAKFSGNKSGTVYYAVTPEVYGPVTDAETLVNPPAYGPTYTARGRINLTASDTEVSVRINGLTVDGSYYLSAVLVDSRGDRSRVKNVLFHTPDNTVPNFATGYPYLSDITETDAQLTAMTTKACQMYYAIFPRGSAAPTGNNFLANSLEGAVASGVFDMDKNTPITEWTARDLLGNPDDPSEQVEYDLYLWLLDFDGGLSSAVRRLQFSTADLTPPEFITLPYVTNEQARAVTLTGSLDEDGTVYWVAVAEGELYPKAPRDPTIDTGAHAVTVIGGNGGGTYEAGDLVTVTPETTTTNVFRRWAFDPALDYTELDPPEVDEDEDEDAPSTFVNGTSTFVMPDQSVTATAYFVAPDQVNNDNAPVIRGTTITTGSGVSLHSEYAKLQVRNGLNGLRSGRVNARAMTDFTINVTGLNPQTRYDVYYIAMDTAGNYSDPVRMVQINTQDTMSPTATQEFTRFPEGETVNTLRPYANTDVRLIFSEEVKGASSSKSLLDLYNDVLNARSSPQDEAVAKDTLGSVLASVIELYTVGTGSSLPTLVTDSSTIDYRNAVITKDDEGRLIITFSYGTGNNSALHLKSGTTYFFRLKDIMDTSTAQNRMAQTDLPRFTTVAAEVFIELENITRLTGVPYGIDAPTGYEGLDKDADIAFSLQPMSTSTMDDSVDWDMLIWLNTSADFELYRSDSSSGPWTQIQNKNGRDPNLYSYDTANGYVGQSVDLRETLNEDYPQLNQDLEEGRKYYFAIHFKQVGTLTDRRSWSANIGARINVMAGISAELSNLSGNVTGGYTDMVADNRVMDITYPRDFTAYKQFSDRSAPTFNNGFPTFEAGDTTVIMHLLLNRTGIVHYILAPVSYDANGENPSSPVTTVDRETGQFPVMDNVPTSGSSGSKVELSNITYREAINQNNFSGNEEIKTGTATVSTVDIPITVSDLKPDTDYLVYFVLEGTDKVYSDYVNIYRFRTVPVVQPVLTLQRNTNSQVTIRTDITADVNYKLVLRNASTLNSNLDGMLLQNFSNYVDPAKRSDFESEAGANGDLSISVLDALVKNYYSPATANGDRPSLFDVFANDYIKEQVRNFIQSTAQGDSIVLNNSTSTRPNESQTIDCTRSMKEGNQYMFFAVAKSPLGSGYSFRANYPVTISDSLAPYVVATPCAFNYTYNSRGQITGVTSATVSIRFNETIYYNDGSSGLVTPTAIDRGPTLDVSRPSGFISAATLATPTNNIAISQEAGQAGIRTDTINLTVTRARGGGYFNLPDGITDAASNTSRGPLSIQMICHYDEDNPASSTMEVIIPAAWDGRTNPPRS